MLLRVVARNIYMICSLFVENFVGENDLEIAFIGQ